MKADAIIIGTGQAGVPLAKKLASNGKNVLVVERGEVGGTCINTGCTPTKTMIASARAAHVARTAKRLGVHTGEVTVDFAAVVARKNRIVREWREGIGNGLSGKGLTLIKGHARFVGPRQVEVNGDRHEAETVVINVGARPAVPPLSGLDGVPWLDNRRALELEKLPSHLVVLGGGYIGCELGQMFRRFGATVTVVEPAPHLLGREDEEVSTEVERVFRAEGIGLELGRKVKSASRAEGGIALGFEGGGEVHGSHLLVATGRRPNTDDLGCDRADIRLDARGFVQVDEQYRTSVPGVYAVGDAIAQPQFTHVAWDDHRRLFDILTGRGNPKRTERHIPYTAYTDPQVAGVGLTEREAKAKGLSYEVATYPFGWIARAIETDETAGTMKIMIDPQTERIIGASVVGAEAGELIHVFVALMQANASPRALLEMQCVHPAFAEGLQSLVMSLKRFS